MNSEKDIAKGSFVSKLPLWLRWVLFLPASAAGSLLIAGLFMLFVSLGVNTSSGTLDGGWYRLLQSALFGGLFVYIGAFTAPKYQLAVGIALLIIAIILISVLSTLIVVTGTQSTWYQILHSASLLIGGGAALYSVYDQLKNK